MLPFPFSFILLISNLQIFWTEGGSLGKTLPKIKPTRPLNRSTTALSRFCARAKTDSKAERMVLKKDLMRETRESMTDAIFYDFWVVVDDGGEWMWKGGLVVAVKDEGRMERCDALFSLLIFQLPLRRELDIDRVIYGIWSLSTQQGSVLWSTVADGGWCWMGKGKARWE